MAGRRDSTAGVAVSLFSGAGGLDLGVELAGYQVRAAVERYADATLTMEKNFPHLASAVIRSDILTVPTSDIMRAAGLGGTARPDLLVGGPPCTPFSKSGFWLDWKRAGLDPDASLLQAYTRVLREAKPRRFILENVYALTSTTRPAGQPTSGCYARSTRPVTTTGRMYSMPLTTASLSHGRDCSSSAPARTSHNPSTQLPATAAHGNGARPATLSDLMSPAAQALDGLITDPNPKRCCAAGTGT